MSYKPIVDQFPIFSSPSFKSYRGEIPPCRKESRCMSHTAFSTSLCIIHIPYTSALKQYLSGWTFLAQWRDCASAFFHVQFCFPRVPFCIFLLSNPINLGWYAPFICSAYYLDFFLTEVSALYIVFGVSNQCLLIK